MTCEEKLLEKIRKVLIANAVLERYVNTHIYMSHPSTIVEPKFPCISMFLLESRPVRSIPDTVFVKVQIDVWFPSAGQFDGSHILSALNEIRTALHLPGRAQELNDTAIGMVCYNSVQTETGPQMYEEETELLHLPAIFEMVVR